MEDYMREAGISGTALEFAAHMDETAGDKVFRAHLITRPAHMSLHCKAACLNVPWTLTHIMQQACSEPAGMFCAHKGD